MKTPEELLNVSKLQLNVSKLQMKAIELQRKAIEDNAKAYHIRLEETLKIYVKPKKWWIPKWLYNAIIRKHLIIETYKN